MRRQQEIYNQTGVGARNKDILNVNMSSDFCQFIDPKFNVSGTTKIIDESKVFNLSGVSFTNILTSGITEAFTNQSISQSCFSGATWSSKLVLDGNVISESTFYTTGSLTGDTPTSNLLVRGVGSALTDTGITYTVSGTTFTIDKPFGGKNLEIYTCVNFGINCHTGNTTIYQYCELSDSNSYSFISSGDTGVYIINTATTIDVQFNFTADTASFTGYNTTFKYEVYKYNPNSSVFITPPVYKSNLSSFVQFSGTSSNILNQSIPVNSLNLDGDYLIKGYYEYDVCTDFMNRLGVRNDTSFFIYGTNYGIYNDKTDGYFIAIKEAEVPIFTFGANTIPLGGLVGITVFPTYDGQTGFTISNQRVGSPIVALNGLVLSEGNDYTFSGINLNFIAETYTGDVITIVYVNQNTSYGFNSDTIRILTAITSGTTNNQGTNQVYYNTTEGKYEVYTSTNPSSSDSIVVSVNGMVLAPNIDFYQSITNSKRIILNGVVLVNDVVNIYYNGHTDVVGNIYTNTQTIAFNILTKPKTTDGNFIIQLSNLSDSSFTSATYSAMTNYVVGQTAYSIPLVVTGGTVGQEYQYRVTNTKEYVSLDGDKILSKNYSEIIPIKVQSNSINSY